MGLLSTQLCFYKYVKRFYLVLFPKKFFSNLSFNDTFTEKNPVILRINSCIRPQDKNTLNLLTV